MLIWFYSTTTNSAILTNTNVRGNTTNVAISDSGRFQNVIHFCFAQFFVVEKSRIGVNIGIETFVDDFALWMDLKGSAYIVLRNFLQRSWKLLLTIKSLWNSDPQLSCIQCAGHSFCSVLGGPVKTTVSPTLVRLASVICKKK